MNRNPPVYVTGIGCICAAGPNLSDSMDALLGEGVHPAPPRRFTTAHPTAYPVFEIDDSIALRGSSAEPEIMRTAQLALTALEEALRDAGWTAADLADFNVGVCMGTTVGCTLNSEEFYREFRSGRPPDMAPVVRYLNSNPSLVIARSLDATGPCQTVVNACSSGTDAIGIGASWVRAGLCDMVIAGGADELCRVTYNGFISLMITDDTACRPFDRRRKGLNLGEGAAVLVLESEASVRRRKHRPQAVMLGYGAAGDAYHLTAPEPQGKGLRRAIFAALEESGMRPGDIAFINAHGTGTPDNDRVESKVLHDLFPGVPFYSTKGGTGHTLGAAGAIEAAFTIASLKAGVIPPSAGFNERDPELPAHPVEQKTAVGGRVALSQSLAFGGTNAVLIFGKE